MKKIIKNQKGFTLIEIIAVLVILGILAAVAVPKFMSLTETAKQKAVDGALSAGQSSVSMQYARLSLSNDAEPDMTTLAKYASNQVGGDFTFTFEASGTTGILITVTREEKTATYFWKRPGL
ncbi:pilus assembly FimT family protein [Desulfonema magnum]|nr:prepilin-type N-terminal cleavage/methylation domain-containing protein [Desulfonema magnum]